MSPIAKNCIKALVLLAIAAGVASCREQEQDRPLLYEQGQYGGKKDTPLTPEQERALELRGRLQKF